MENIYKHSSCEANYLKDKQRMIFTFNGYINLDEAKKMYLTALDFMKVNQIVAFINDLREIKGTFTAMNKWLFENMRESIELGLKYDAMVLNEDIFTAFAANDFIKKVKILEVQIFKTLDEAEEWLDSTSV